MSTSKFFLTLLAIIVGVIIGNLITLYIVQQILEDAFRGF